MVGELNPIGQDPTPREGNLRDLATTSALTRASAVNQDLLATCLELKK